MEFTRLKYIFISSEEVSFIPSALSFVFHPAQQMKGRRPIMFFLLRAITIRLRRDNSIKASNSLQMHEKIPSKYKYVAAVFDIIWFY